MVPWSHIHTIAFLIPFLQTSFGKSSTMTGGNGLRSQQSGEARQLEDYTETELQYFSDCEDILLGETIIGDGLISQNEFATAYSGLCNAYSLNGCPDTSFGDLPSEIQSLFFEAVCEKMPDNVQCVANLNSMNSMAVGYIVSSETAATVQMRMGDLCLELLDYAFATEASAAAATPMDEPSSTTPVVDTSSLGRPPRGDGSVSLPLNQDSGSATGEPVQKPENNSEEILDLTAVDSDPTAPSTGPKTKNTNQPSNNGPIIGIAVVAAACLLLLLFVAYRKYQATRLPVKSLQQPEGDNASTSDDSDPEAPSPHPHALVVKKVKESLPQYDVSATAADIALKMPSDASSASRSTLGRGFMFSPKPVSVDQIEEAVDKGNWDSVYKLASQLAEQEDLSTLSSAGRQNMNGELSIDRLEKRANLREEDHDRAKTLDELISNRDWTGVAVTAALYAGESGYQKQSRPSGGSLFGRITGRRASNAALEASSRDSAYQNDQSALGPFMNETTSDTTNEDIESRHVPSNGDIPLLQLKNSMDQAVDAGDWDQVLRISSEVENNGAFQSRHIVEQNSIVVSIPSNTSSTELPSPSGGTEAFKTLIEEMDHAMNRGDWALVAFYADKIREIKISGDETSCHLTSRALVPLSRPQPISTSRSEDSWNSIMNKKSTLEKLVQAEKWKGVSIMAGLYEMEAKNSSTSPSELS